MQYNKARELVAKNPELGKWISLGDPGTNDFTIAEPFKKGLIWDTKGPTPAEREQINQAIYGASASSSPVSPGRAKAIEELKKIGIVNPNEKQIQEAIKDLGL